MNMKRLKNPGLYSRRSGHRPCGEGEERVCDRVFLRAVGIARNLISNYWVCAVVAYHKVGSWVHEWGLGVLACAETLVGAALLIIWVQERVIAHATTSPGPETWHNSNHLWRVRLIVLLSMETGLPCWHSYVLHLATIIAFKARVTPRTCLN